MSKILITGGAGFIGGFLADRLAKAGHDLVLVDNFSRGKDDAFLAELVARDNVDVATADLLDDNAWEALKSHKPDAVYHLAAIVGVANVAKAPYRVLDENIKLTSNVIRFCEEAGVEHLLFASTSEVVAGTLKQYGIEIPTPETTPFTLPDPSDNRATYALSKIVGESLCYHSKVRTTIFRPHNIYGPRMGLSHVIPEMIKKLTSGITEIDVASPEHSRTFCFIDDAVSLLVGFLERDANAGDACFNLGTGSPEIAIRELVEKVGEVVGFDGELVLGDDTPGSPARRCPDMSAAKAATGIESEVSLDEGIRRTYAWYREFLAQQAA